VVRVPRYTSLTVNAGASLSTDAWNGSTGGIIAIEVVGTTTISGNINTSGKGFRGGVLKQTSDCCPNGAGYGAIYATTVIDNGAEKEKALAEIQLHMMALVALWKGCSCKRWRRR